MRKLKKRLEKIKFFFFFFLINIYHNILNIDINNIPINLEIFLENSIKYLYRKKIENSKNIRFQMPNNRVDNNTFTFELSCAIFLLNPL